MNNEHKVNILKKYFLDMNGEINLSDIDLGNIDINLSSIRAKSINNSGQEARFDIFNSRQKSSYI